MNKSILIIEDEKALVMALRDRLESEGYQCSAKHDGIRGEKESIETSYDCIILDVMLPYRDGFQVCRNIRSAGVTTPILMLTARNTAIDTVMGLKLGADDYLAKPFDMQVLLARVEALIRRSVPIIEIPGEPDAIQFGTFLLDIPNKRLLSGDTPVSLNATEYKLLHYLASHSGKVVCREKLLEEVWGYELLVSTRTVDVHVARLRQKLNEGLIPQYLVTVRGMGYRFDA